MAEKKQTPPSEQKPAVTLDKRLLDRNLAKGRLTREDFEKHLAALPDLGDKSENIAALVYPTQG